jgi:hypothetical protein
MYWSNLKFTSYDGKLMKKILIEGDKANAELMIQENGGVGIFVRSHFYGINNITRGQEVTINFEFENFDNDNTFYTDSNGLEMQERKLNYRPSWNFTTEQPVSANYYPVNSAIAMRDQHGMLISVQNDRTQGGSVLKAGRIEMMVQRRMLEDDNRGAGEALNETNEFGNGQWVRPYYYINYVNPNFKDIVNK